MSDGTPLFEKLKEMALGAAAATVAAAAVAYLFFDPEFVIYSPVVGVNAVLLMLFFEITYGLATTDAT